MRKWLRPDQITATLERHGYPPDTPVLGTRYADEGITVVIAGKRLVVPADVLLMEAPASGEERRRSLFH